MDDQRLGAAIRALRVRRGLRQADVAVAARLSRTSISRIERGHLGHLSLVSLRAVAATLDARLEILPRWRGGELERLLNERHSAMHEEIARFFRSLPGWVAQPEVSFSIFGERGAIDVLAWHPQRRALLVIELKTEIVDVQELVGNLDRKRRLAPRIARERGWQASSVATWLIVLAGRTNRRRISAHAAMLRAVFPNDGRQVASWLRDPGGPFDALSFWPDSHAGNAGPGAPSHEPGAPSRKRVRLPRTSEAGSR